MPEGIDPALAEIKRRAKGNELTYGFVMDCLKNYKSPRAKLTQLLRSKALIRLKKGFYVFGELNRNGLICKELLANMIYGPSYVSLEWALAHYGLIPEAALHLTSVSTLASKNFKTPLGTFYYEHVHQKHFPIAFAQEELSKYQKYLIATPEKALIDYLMLRHGRTRSDKQMTEILFEDMRIEEEDLSNLDLKLAREIYENYPHSATKHFLNILEKLQ